MLKNLFLLTALVFHLSCQSTTKTGHLVVEQVMDVKSIGNNLALPDSYKLPNLEAIPSLGQSLAPQFSEEGRYLIFQIQDHPHHKNSQIYEYDFQSKNLKRLTHQNGNAVYPDYVDQSQAFIFSSSTDEEKESPDLIELQINPKSEPKMRWMGNFPYSEVYFMKRDTSQLSRLTIRPGPDLYTSGTGDSIFYSSLQKNKPAKIVEINISGKLINEFAIADAHLISPVLSKNKSMILALKMSMDQKNTRLLVANYNKNPQWEDIITKPGQIRKASWHPTEQILLFSANFEGEENYEIYSYNIASKCLHRLSFHTADDRDPVFSPDGKRIAFASNREGYYRIFSSEYSPSPCIQ